VASLYDEVENRQSPRNYSTPQHVNSSIIEPDCCVVIEAQEPVEISGSSALSNIVSHVSPNGSSVNDSAKFSNGRSSYRY